MRFFYVLCNGDTPLVKTFWIYGFMLRILLEAPLRYLKITVYDESLPLEINAPIYAYDYLLFGYTVISCVAIWRSADKYQGRKFWGTLAKTWGIISAIMAMYT